MTNRVDELESEIAELRAAVNGLTEELVETKARVRELEEAESEPADQPIPEETTTKSDDHVQVVEPNDEADQSAPETASEEDNTAESTETTDDSEAESSDIIVA